MNGPPRLTRSTLIALGSLLALAVFASASAPRKAAPVAETPAPVVMASADAAPVVAAPTAAPLAARTIVAPKASSRLASAPAEAGMRAFRDPQTGLVSGVVSEGSAQLLDINPLNDTAEGLVPITLSDGSMMLDLEGRFEQYYVIEIGADGRRHVRCGANHSHDAAVHSTPTLPEER